MTRTTAPTEPCAGCRRPVTPNRWTERSRWTNRPWCDSCGTATAATFLVDGESRFAAVTRSYNDSPDDRKVRCEHCAQMRPAVTSVKAKDGTWTCENCRKDHLDPALHSRSAVEREMDLREEMGEELWAIRSEFMGQVADRGWADPELIAPLERFYNGFAEEDIRGWYDDTYETRSLDDDGVGPTLTPSGLWTVRTAAGNGHYADYEFAEERAAEVRAGLR